MDLQKHRGKMGRIMALPGLQYLKYSKMINTILHRSAMLINDLQWSAYKLHESGQSMTIYDNLELPWTSKAPSGKPILAVRESIKSSLVSPPMPLTRYSARSTMPSSSSSWTKPCLAQLGNRSAEQVALLSIASCQIPGHQWFVICSMRTLAHLSTSMHILDHLSTLRAHRNLLRLSLPHLYRFLSHSFPFYVLRVSACIFPSAPHHWNPFCTHSIPFPNFSQSLPTLMILMPGRILGLCALLTHQDARAGAIRQANPAEAGHHSEGTTGGHFRATCHARLQLVRWVVRGRSLIQWIVIIAVPQMDLSRRIEYIMHIYI